MLRIRHTVRGGHVTCRVFYARHRHRTWVLLGYLTLRTGAEWDDFRAMLASVTDVQFEHDDESFVLKE